MSGPRARASEVQLALMLLTRLPAGRLADPAPPLASSRWAWPLVGVVVGALVWAVVAGAGAAGLPPGVGALLALGGATLVTGGLHEDGLADYADGAGAGGDRARRLAIMADSRIGTYGALALAFTLGLRVAAVAALAPTLAQAIAVAVGARAAMLAVQGALPPARPGGLGAAAAARDGWRGPVGLAIGGVALAGAGLPGLAAGLAMACAAGTLAAHARARLGGQTGDVLGAAQQVAEVSGWLALLAMAR